MQVLQRIRSGSRYRTAPNSEPSVIGHCKSLLLYYRCTWEQVIGRLRSDNLFLFLEMVYAIMATPTSGLHRLKLVATCISIALNAFVTHFI